MGAIRLTTTLAARGPAAAVVLDDEQVAEIGEGGKRFTVNGYSWRTSVARMRGEFLARKLRRFADAVSVSRRGVRWSMNVLDTSVSVLATRNVNVLATRNVARGNGSGRGAH